MAQHNPDNINSRKGRRNADAATPELMWPLNAEALLIPATRYFMGRCTIAAACHARGLAEQWKILPVHIRSILRQDIAEELARDDAARVRGESVLPLGQNCDRDLWDLVRRAWLSEDEPDNPVNDVRNSAPLC